MNAPEQTRPSVAAVVPTRSRPEKLGRCLTSLAAARERLRFPAYVCDSSPDEAERAAVRAVCERYGWVTLVTHSGANIAAARNACVHAAKEDLLVSIDDDLELEPEAVDRLVACYMEGQGPRVVSGSVTWDGTWTAPMKMRPIGYSRLPRDGEKPDFVLGALFLYPRSLGLACPWNERIARRVDIFMGAVWRSHGVRILFAAEARARHEDLPASLDPSRLDEAVHNERWHVYVLLFDALIANPSIVNAVSYEVLGFMASGKQYLRRPRWAIGFVYDWIVGHIRLWADRRYLRALAREESLAVDS
jgi:glycosyltransferase involved in cell wall biosynthesis